MNSISWAKQGLYSTGFLRLRYTNHEEERHQCREPNEAGSSESEVPGPFLCRGGGAGSGDASASHEAFAGSFCGSGLAYPIEKGHL